MQDKPQPTKIAQPLSDEGRPQANRLVEELRLIFERTGNQFEVWTAYGVCRALGLSLPEWILLDFDGVVARLGLDFVGRKPGALDERPITERHWTSLLAEAFGFSVNESGGPRDPFDRWMRTSRDIALARHVRGFVDDGNNETNACMLVAQEHGVSEPTVRRAWKLFAPIARLSPLRPSRPSRTS